MDRVVLLDGVVAGKGERFRVRMSGFRVGAGETVAIVGKSGSGKSTILDTIAGILRPIEVRAFRLMSGAASVDMGKLWAADDQRALRAARARHIGYVLQTGGLAPFLSIEQNIALPLWRDGGQDPGWTRHLMEKLGIAGLARRLPRDVSVGERQRAAIARALAGKPDLVLADEPTASLDSAQAEATMALLTALARETGVALLMVTHDRALVERHGFRMAICQSADNGQSDLLSDPAAEGVP
ncbi:ABC transporter ATP-binding protein [Rhodospirillum rubrum]|uniref:ABC transporter component n=1 Tax=Rhodospirillum rubrum (strain ATCC 11170 / ATH 1.1.1 / DSM 467 / LMG 4362 / NCIMB 8255 / S1) TaxID=269796 RepID=Q2RPK0_RHORT|nr:ATP-binding cassette domain-containing protein [Rhodospirillum rubrum]ABC23945.1 ABC transporter component [Rhodospirillum rubrum ATCC 11170]AEO49690.1 ABC transporter protein [Rhodospirillum rubrum F11]MBK5955605.1 ABC transporter [Rhodospirillum rubrum]QXG79889.1 ATP-binding cassette domain-containing protein [Rhodospirillum rubrum]HAQ00574.1 ABC transporter [Rhodospirillum rubrum]